MPSIYKIFYLKKVLVRVRGLVIPRFKISNGGVLLLLYFASTSSDISISTLINGSVITGVNVPLRFKSNILYGAVITLVFSFCRILENIN